MSLIEDQIDWHAPAYLKRKSDPSNRTFAWVSASTHYGTVAEMVHVFRAMPPEQQGDFELVTDAGVIAGNEATVFAVDALAAIAARPDLPSAA